MNRRPILVVVLLVFFLSSVATADVGTPLMMASAFHLVIGNALIGIFEGILLAKVFRLKMWKAIALMIPANYVSAWIGVYVIFAVVPSVAHVDLNNGLAFFWLMAFLTYLMTLVFEFPFVALSFWRDPAWFRKAVRGSLIVQTASYVLLFGWYWAVSGRSLYTDANIVQASVIDVPKNIVVYFIGEDDGNVYKINLTNPVKQKVFDLNSTSLNDRLSVRASLASNAKWDLFALLETKNPREPKLAPILTSFASVVAPEPRIVRTGEESKELTWRNASDANVLGNADNDKWEFFAGFWAVDGLHAKQKKTGTQVQISFETPFCQWYIRNLTQLPADKVLFQLGDDQICLFDPETKNVALVTHGRGPIAVIEAKEADPVLPKADP